MRLGGGWNSLLAPLAMPTCPPWPALAIRAQPALGLEGGLCRELPH